jgi:hypothetical protein
MLLKQIQIIKKNQANSDNMRAANRGNCDNGLMSSIKLTMATSTTATVISQGHTLRKSRN